MKIKTRQPLLLLSALLALVMAAASGCGSDKRVAGMAEALEPLDLKPFVNFSAFDDIQAGWQLPRGSHVFDGVPFQVDGVIQLQGSGRPAGQGHLQAPVSVTGIPVNHAFERLHLLTAVDGSAAEGAVVARIILAYTDGSKATLELKYGDQVRNWTAPWHRNERALRDTNCCVVWHGQNSDPASVDRFMRLFHVVLDNPKPDKMVQTLSLEAVVTNVGPLFAGIAIGPAQAERLTNTVTFSSNPFPDLRRRKGDLAAIQGVIKTFAGQPIGGARVQALASRNFNTRAWEADKKLPDNIVTTTGADGQFSLPPLPDNQLYLLRVSSDGMQPASYLGADPKSDPLEIRLRALKPELEPPTTITNQ